MDFFERFLNSLENFALNSKIDVALGMLIGAGIRPVANSIVNDFIMPVRSLVGGKKDLKNKYFLLKAGKTDKVYNTVEQARKDGAIVISYGNFMSVLLNFAILSGSAYIFAAIIKELRTKKIDIPDLPKITVPNPISSLNGYSGVYSINGH